MISASKMCVFPCRFTSLPRRILFATGFTPSLLIRFGSALTHKRILQSKPQHKYSIPSFRPFSSSSSLKMSTRRVEIDSNLVLWRAMQSEESTTSPSAGSEFKKKNEKLVILFAYMLPKERHIEKYREMYHERGFDVLTITTSPLQFFLPVLGAQKIASTLLSYLDNNLNVYPSMVVHAFSVGGYQFSELVKLLNDRSSDLRSDPLSASIKAMVFDSPCDVDSVPYGLSHTVAGDTLIAKIFQAVLNFTRFIFYPVSTKHHTAGAAVFINKPLQCPSLFFASECDKMANIKVIRSVVDTWTQQGVQVDLKCWPNTRHVSHFHTHPQEYVSLVENLLRKVKLI